MKWIIITIIAAVVLGYTTDSPALHVKPDLVTYECLPAEGKLTPLDWVTAGFGEHILAKGITLKGAGIMYIMVNPRTGTWTIFELRAKDGWYCLYAAGDSFEVEEFKG